MRVWSLDPALLDRAGLVACWRETLLAQAVLAGKTKGYTNHPQLDRFKADPDPLVAVGMYLQGIQSEAVRRTYKFDQSRIIHAEAPTPRITVTTGQLKFELAHLRAKLEKRAPEMVMGLDAAESSIIWSDPAQVRRLTHPLFKVVEGGIEAWERP
ncbi:pyrimidine dimer DNA glycosylase/endonuclease V [Timonella senegalensis]|uniref:pyrimidine dimer DNA glycosylase/endonuclease V n=1 Tax=Timonella senegalensis TaxID=1465825 RepID=UPI002FDDF06B